MCMKKYLKKLLNSFFWILDKINKNAFVKKYPQYLRWLGVDINTEESEDTWISPTIFLDSARYDYIHIGKNVTISFDVTVLVHDYSIVHAGRTVGGYKTKDIIYKEVLIGNNVFIGAKTIILPGTSIGDNCIIGAGSVVKGRLESDSIYVGNPATKIGNVETFAEKYSFLLR